MNIGIAGHTETNQWSSPDILRELPCNLTVLDLVDFSATSFLEQIAGIDAIFFHHSCYNFEELVMLALRKRKHVLIDCASMTDALTMRKICNLAEEADVIFQIRNTVLDSELWQATLGELKNPGFIEYRRTNLDVSQDQSSLLKELVPDVLLMLSAIKSNVKRVAASQVSHPNGKSAVINVRLEFDNGTTASLIHSSMPSHKNATVNIVQQGSFIDVDFYTGQASIAENSHCDQTVSSRILAEQPTDKSDLERFVKALYTQKNTGPDAFDAGVALSVGYEILDKLRIPAYRGGIAS